VNRDKLGGLINHFVFFLYQILFRLLARVFPSRPVELKGRDFSSILVFSAAGIGDALTDSVAIRALKETFPGARLTVVTHRRRSVIARHNPFVDDVALYHKSFPRFVSLARELRSRRYDLVIMLRGNDPDLWPLAWLANRHAVVSCPIMTRFKFLISHPVPIPSWDRTHGVEQTLEIARYAGADTRDRRLVYRVREEERASLRQKMIPWRIKESPLVIFQAGGGWRSEWRDWPVAHYAVLGKRLLDEYDVQLVLLGGVDHRAKAGAIRAALVGEAVNLAGELSLAESAALLSLAVILVSTDTGIMHLGFAVGVDTLALIHCNNPASRVGPHGYGDQHQVVQLQPPPGEPISKNVDMGRVTPEQAWPKLEQLCERNNLQKKH